MKIKEVKNVNYCATIARVSNIIELDNCDNVQAAIVLGCQNIVDKNVKKDDMGVFFPVECKLSDEFLSNNNLYRHKEKNVDKEKSGYFEDNGRLKAVKFRKHKAEGLFLPMDCLDFINLKAIPSLGQDFDELNDIPICQKYVIKRKNPQQRNQGKQIKHISRLVDNQFRLHYDTAQLKKNIHMIKPDSLVSISAKFHGTSAVFANVLVKRKITIRDRIASLFGVKIERTEYDLLYSSRKVIKNDKFRKNKQQSYYTENIWETWANKTKEFIPKGMSVYAEIVGYLSSGSMIQKPYHYACEEGTSELYIYRITQTNTDGIVTELTRPEIDEYCFRNGLTATPLLYYGKAKDIYPNIAIDDDWHDNVLRMLVKDENFCLNDMMCEFNNDEVPAEGCVIRVESIYNMEPYKLKNYKFLEYETKMLDSGEEDIEESDSE